MLHSKAILSSPPPGNIWQCLETFLFIRIYGRHWNWKLGSRRQEHWRTSYVAQHAQPSAAKEHQLSCPEYQECSSWKTNTNPLNSTWWTELGWSSCFSNNWCWVLIKGLCLSDRWNVAFIEVKIMRHCAFSRFSI